jgi:uncharacterized integral membrane protein
MNKTKMIFWLIILSILALLFYQNQDFFLTQQHLRINLLFKEFNTPELPSTLFFLSFFLAGFLIAYFSGLYAKYKHKQEIKSLNLKINSKNEAVLKMEADNKSLKEAISIKNKEEAGSQISKEQTDAPDLKNGGV